MPPVINLNFICCFPDESPSGATTDNSGTEKINSQDGGERSGLSTGSFLFSKCLKAKSIPEVLHQEYDKDGRLVGVAILMQAGTIPVTVQEPAQ